MFCDIFNLKTRSRTAHYQDAEELRNNDQVNHKSVDNGNRLGDNG